ncbi:MAG: hypothetical protein A2479_00475 [Candidatus Magasanikbacteria bacterium RIFOXYC2_FULL_39_8]|nr:MAG: hypothetical protein A2479_00475 [Candidatus Magasanikbacteria bacterium RIFOXYC2_FULL_39_8]
MELKPSKIHQGGVGLFATVNIKKNEVVEKGTSKEDHQKVTAWSELKGQPSLVRRLVKDFCIGIPNGFRPPSDLDFNHLSISWYLNHSCDGNLGFNEDGDFIALRYIRKGEELSYDYGLAESNPKFKMVCYCGAKQCRGVITGNDWKNKNYQQKYFHYFIPILREFAGKFSKN